MCHYFVFGKTGIIWGPLRRRIQVQIFSCTWQLGFSGFIFFLDKKHPFPTSLTPCSRGALCQSEYTSSEALFPVSTDGSSDTELTTLVSSPSECFCPPTCHGLRSQRPVWWYYLETGTVGNPPPHEWDECPYRRGPRELPSSLHVRMRKCRSCSDSSCHHTDA